MLSDITVDFHPGLVARSWKPSNCMLKTLMRRCRQHQLSTKIKRLILQLRTMHDTLVDSAVSVYPSHTEYEEEWWQHTSSSVSKTHSERFITSVLACHKISFFSPDEDSCINCRNVGKFLTCFYVFSASRAWLKFVYRSPGVSEVERCSQWTVVICHYRHGRKRLSRDTQACPWECHSYGNPMGNVPWDGTAHICISHETQK